MRLRGSGSLSDLQAAPSPSPSPLSFLQTLRVDNAQQAAAKLLQSQVAGGGDGHGDQTCSSILIRIRVGFVGWRGMVGSVLLQRMAEESDFEVGDFEPVRSPIVLSKTTCNNVLPS